MNVWTGIGRGPSVPSMTSTTSTTLAMHMSDGIVNAPVSFAFAVIAVVGLTGCCWRARADLDERAVPMAGLVAAFIFAVQMINFPILPGVSGHLLGGALAAILVGAALAVSGAIFQSMSDNPLGSPDIIGGAVNGVALGGGAADAG